MSVALSKLNPVEKFFFGAAVGLGCLLLLLRFGTFALLWYSHHVR